jgi:DNA polymerase
MCWNTDPKKGPSGWIRVDTYGGKLTENIVQAIARDILTYAMVNLENAGYPIVLHVHDEIVAEILKSFGSIKEFEKIMNIMPPWAQGWPIRATGGWRGKRYRKE